MKQIQIPEQLFMELVKFHLLDMEENLPSIKQGLEAKLDSLVMRDLYSKYKTAPTECYQAHYNKLIFHFSCKIKEVLA